MARQGGSYYAQNNEEIDDKLTDKQVMFIEEYLKCFSVTQAAKKAGYSSNIAWINQNETVGKEIARRMDEVKNENIATQQEVMETLTSILRGEKQDYENEQVKKVNETVERKSVKGSGTPTEEARLRAAEMLGKAHGMFIDKKQVDANVEMVQFVDDIEENDENE